MEHCSEWICHIAIGLSFIQYIYLYCNGIYVHVKLKFLSVEFGMCAVLTFSYNSAQHFAGMNICVQAGDVVMYWCCAEQVFSLL